MKTLREYPSVRPIVVIGSAPPLFRLSCGHQVRIDDKGQHPKHEKPHPCPHCK